MKLRFIHIFLVGLMGWTAYSAAEAMDLREYARLEARYQEQLSEFSSMKEINLYTGFKGAAIDLSAKLLQMLAESREVILSFNQLKDQMLRVSLGSNVSRDLELEVYRQFIILKMHWLKQLEGLFGFTPGAHFTLFIDDDQESHPVSRSFINGFHFELLQSYSIPGPWFWSPSEQRTARLSGAAHFLSNDGKTKVCVNGKCQIYYLKDRSLR